MVFSLWLKPEFSWTSINCFSGFSSALTEKVPSSLNEGRRLTRIFLITTAFLILFIWLRWRITLLKQRGLCELSEIAEILSIVNVMVFRLFIHKPYLFDCMKTREPWTNCQGPRIISNKRKISHRQGIKVFYERRLFSKMNFVDFVHPADLVIILHVIEYSIESWTGKNSDELPACIEKAYMVVTFSVQISR